MASRRARANPDQMPLSIIVPETSWEPPTELPDLPAMGVRRVALDTEDRDDGLSAGRGPGWAYKSGYICGVSAAWDGGGRLYAPIRHPDTANLDAGQVARWVQHLMRSGIDVIFQNSSFDLGWMGAEWGTTAPTGRLHDTQGMAYILDENRFSYSLDNICKWMGVTGKDDSLLLDAGRAFGLGSKRDEIMAGLWRLPARFVGPYAEQDAVVLLELADRMLPRIQAEGSMAAYELEMDLIPMVVAMRRRGVRVDLDRAAETQERLNAARDRYLAELSGRVLVGRQIAMHDINSPAFLEAAFDAEGIRYPRTPKTDRGSFSVDWMGDMDHWLPQLVVNIQRMDMAANKFLQGFIMDYAHNGRIHAEVHQYRTDSGGTRSHRFSYSDPPLQQMYRAEPDKATPGHKDYIEGFVDVGSLIRGVFIPEEDEYWNSTDYSQQEYRLIVHFATVCRIARATEAADKYRSDPSTDFHSMVAEMTGLPRKPAKDTNFAKAFGAGVGKFALMTGRSFDDAKAIYEQYDTEMPFVKGLNEYCDGRAARRGFIRLLDGARAHFDMWEPSWYKGPFHPSCDYEEAMRRINDPNHDWHGCRIRRSETRLAMSRLIQGSAARQTKMAMRECWREGLLPLLQMHDELCFSVSTREQTERVADIMTNVVKLEVPMKVDVELGLNWGEAKLSWDELMEKIAA